MKQTIMNKDWWEAAGIRAIKTAAQSFIAGLPVTAIVLDDVNWGISISAAVLAAVISFATSLSGLPEVGGKEK